MKRGRSSSVVVSEFFRVYLAGESGDDLELPISINSSLPKPLPRTVTVRSIYGKNWNLVLRKCDGNDVERFALVNGWKRIAEDEGLKERDFLVFEFDGSRCFNFCVFNGSTMCKRLRNTSMGTDEVKSESDGDDGDHSFSDSIEAEYEDDDDDVETVDASDDDHRKYLDDRENPSFTRTLSNKMSQVLIPARVIRDYNLNFSQCITIVDPLAKKFGTLNKPIKIEASGCVFVRDFGGIIKRNQVKLADKMVFELKTTGDNLVQTMKMYVIKGQ